jgi:hypothetical protein
MKECRLPTKNPTLLGHGTTTLAVAMEVANSKDHRRLPPSAHRPSAVRIAQWGRTVDAVDGPAVEVEEFVEHDGRMNIPLRLLRGAVLLAGIRDALADLRLGPEGDDCPFANWISPIDVAASHARWRRSHPATGATRPITT